MDHELDRPRGHGGGGFKMSEGDWTCEEEGYVISSFSFILGWSAHFSTVLLLSRISGEIARF